jgi:hypothetical protein
MTELRCLGAREEISGGGIQILKPAREYASFPNQPIFTVQ